MSISTNVSPVSAREQQGVGDSDEEEEEEEGEGVLMVAAGLVATQSFAAPEAMRTTEAKKLSRGSCNKISASCRGSKGRLV
jgi:hypothetical protein